MSGKNKTDSTGKPKNLHANHRSRMLRQYRSSGGAQMLPHQLLEILLFYCIPRRDTNPIAHQLLQKFGSIPNLLQQSEKELCDVPGIGPSSARLIRSVGAIRTYLHASAKQTMHRLTVERLMKQLDEALPEPPASGLLLLLVDGRGKLYPPIVITESLCYSTNLRPLMQKMLRELLSRCQIKHLSTTVLVELGLTGMPTTEQVLFARLLKSNFQRFEIPLWDYIVRTPDRDYSFERLMLM